MDRLKVRMSGQLEQQELQAAQGSTVAQIVEVPPVEDMTQIYGCCGAGGQASPAHVIARWRTPGGELQQEAVTLPRGLQVSAGDLVLLQRPANWPEWIITQVVQSLHDVSLPSAPEVFADGKRLKVDASEEIVLRCGKASITLRSNGRLIIRGAYVETHASGTNRIKGGAVLIN